MPFPLYSLCISPLFSTFILGQLARMLAYSEATFIWYESLILIATLLRLLGLLCAEHLMIPQLRARVVASFLIVSWQCGGLEKCNVIAPALVEPFLSIGASAPVACDPRLPCAAPR